MPRRRVALASYEATLDPCDSGRVAFRLERVNDVADTRALREPRPNATAIRSAVALHQALEDADPGDLASGLRLPRFYMAFPPSKTPRFGPGGIEPAEGAGVAIEGLRAWPAELFAGRDCGTTRGPAPVRIYASLAQLKGRAVRNPAFGVLRRHGLIPRGLGYRAWRSSVRRGDGLSIQDPGDGATAAGRLRRAIEEYAGSDPAREAALLAEMDAACMAMGVKIPEGADGVDALAGLLDNPWAPAAVPYAAAVQVVGLSGPPGPATMTFSDGAADAALFDLTRAGQGRDPFEPAGEAALRGMPRR